MDTVETREQAAPGAEALARADAQQERDTAESERSIAEQNEAVAHGRELVLEAEKVVSSDPELSAHLALGAHALLTGGGEDPAQAVAALRAAIAADRIVARFPGGDFVSVHPSGSLLALGAGDEAVVVDIDTGEQLERHGREGDFAIGAAFSPDGNLLAVAFQGGTPPVTVWNRTTGASFDLGTRPGAFLPGLKFSPDGDLLAYQNEVGQGIEVWSVGERRRVFQDPLGASPDFSPKGLLSYAQVVPTDQARWEVRIVDPVSGASVRAHPIEVTPDFLGGQFTSWSPNGEWIAAGTQAQSVVIDAVTGEPISSAETEDLDLGPAEWLTGSDAYVSGGKTIDAMTGEIRSELLGLRGAGASYGAVPETTLVAAAGSGQANFVRGSETVLFETAPVIGEAAVGSPYRPWPQQRDRVHRRGSRPRHRCLRGGLLRNGRPARWERTEHRCWRAATDVPAR